MRCNICNAVLSPAEVQWNSDHEDWDPCNKCQAVIDEVFSDDTEEEIDAQLEFELYEEDDCEPLPEEKA